MFRFLLRSLWRLIILALGIASLSLIVILLWPESNSRLTIFVVLLITYCLMAYFVVPNLMRLFHVFSKTDHIPLYAATGDGWPSDPINIALIVRNRSHLEKVMIQSGWHVADPLTFSSGLREFIAIIFNRKYPAAPLSNLYLFDRPHDIGFEISSNKYGSPRTRHHVRFWKLEAPQDTTMKNSHFTFWETQLKSLFQHKKEIWIGAATEDHKIIGVQWRTGQITHGVSDDADRERDFILEGLKSANSLVSLATSEPGQELRFHGQQFQIGKKRLRMTYITDGSIKIATLR